MPVEGEVVLIYFQDQPTIFARIESIEPDVKRGWYQVILLLLTVPTRTVTWILRETYINGAPFTMDGKAIRLAPVKRVTAGEKKTPSALKPGSNKEEAKTATVIPFRKTRAD